MAGIGTYGLTGPSGYPRDYLAAGDDTTAPDDCIGFYAKSAGNVQFRTVQNTGGGTLTFPMTAGSFLPGEIATMVAWSGTVGDIFYVLR